VIAATGSDVHNERVTRVPRIDLGLSGRGDAPLAASVILDVAEACREVGFFQVTGHGIDPRRIRELRDQMRRFFSLPAERKREVRRSEQHAWGYYDSELTKNTPDWKEVFDFGRLPHPDRPEHDPSNVGVDGPNRWPRDLPGFREAMLDYLRACERVAFRLLEAMAIGLAVPSPRLTDHFRPTHSSFLRLNHYPRCDDAAPPDAPDLPSSGRLGVNQHSDAGALTLVAQTDSRGLQVRTEGGWIDVERIPDALVVNIGDMMQVWSNDRYRSPVHRVVVNETTERFSAPFFFNPSYAASCEPLPELVAVDGEPHYRAISWGEFRRLRAAGDYADVGEEVQIAHYRVPRSS